MREFLASFVIIGVILVAIFFGVSWYNVNVAHTPEKIVACEKQNKVYYSRLDACVDASQPWLDR